MMRCK